MADLVSDISIKCGLPTTTVYYKSAVRTTLSDIMCTTNSATAYLPAKRDKLKALVATMPYERSKSITGPLKGATLFQKMKVNDITLKKTEELRRSRDEFVQKVKREKFELDKIKSRCATKIQAVFRGFRVRPRKEKRPLKVKEVVVLSQSEIHEELCVMAAKLQFPPIPGLNLEAKSKASKRRRKIEAAATFRIQRFFKMLLARKRARDRLREKREEKKNIAAGYITRFFRFAKVKKAASRREEIKKSLLIVKLQCSERVHQSHAKYAPILIIHKHTH